MSDKKTLAIGKGLAGPGRKKGQPNKNTAALKEMILGALDEAGGIGYLVRQARDKPVAFLALVGKVLPMTVLGANPDGSHSITVNIQQF